MNPINRKEFIATAATLTAGVAASAMPVAMKDEKKQLVHHVFSG